MSDQTEGAEKKRKPYPRRKPAPNQEPRGVIKVEKHHALFRPPQGQDWQPEKFERIYVSRVRTDGELEEVPKWFSPDELADLEPLRERFGGGVYELRAIRYDGTVYRIVRTNRLPGPSKPLYYVPEDENEEETQPPIAPPVPGDSGGQMLSMFQIMLAESRAANERMMAMMQQSNQMMISMQQHSTEVLVAALTGNKQDVPGMITAVAGAVRQNAPAPAPASDPVDQIKKIHDLTKQLSAPPVKEESVAEIVGAAAQGIGALVMAQQAMHPNAPQPPNVQPLPPAPNGSPTIAG